MNHRKAVSGLSVIFLSIFFISPVFAQDAPIPKQLIRRKIREGMSVRNRELEKAREMGLTVRGELPGGGVFELKTLSTPVPTYFITHNEAAARSTRTDSIHVFWGGAPGFTLGVWDGGAVRVTHQEFGGRATWKDSFSYGTHPHSTHVGATMAASGFDPAAKGMAWEADLISYEWSFDDLEAESEAQDGLLLSNHSYGHARGWVIRSSGTAYWYGDVSISETEDYMFGFYSDVSKVWDEVARRNPYYLTVTSAGNDRNDAVPPGTRHYVWNPMSGGWVTSTDTRDNDGGELGYDCLPDGMSTAKNTLVIGAVEDVTHPDDPDSIAITDFSSWGPTDDGRIKPDICGNGYRLYSALDGSDAAYGIYSGTSMASPNVCGSLGLLQARYAEVRGGRMLASTVKALAIHTAKEAGPHPGPDYGFGWGLLDAWAAFRHIEADSNGTKGLIAEMTLYDGKDLELFYEPEEGADRMTVTIAWTDPASEIPAPALNDRTPLLVNDIDLRITGPGGESRPWILDPDDPSAAAGRGDNFRDNVEQVVIDDPAPGTYVVKLSNKGRLRGGSQVVSVIVSGAKRTKTWHVYEDGSGDAPTIGEAVRLAEPGDQIFVFPGTYFEHDIVIDKNLLIKGVDGAEVTTIDAYIQGRCFIVRMPGEMTPGDGNTLPTGGAVEIEGLTFHRGVAEGEGFEGRGGAIFCDEARVEVSACVFDINRANEGGAIYLRDTRSAVSDCLIHTNRATAGGGIFLLRSPSVLTRNLILSNEAGTAAGILLENSSAEIIQCTIARNDRGPAAGIHVRGGGRPRIWATIVAFGEGTGIYAEGISSRPNVVCCDVYGNRGGNYGGSLSDQTGIQGNISEDPLFCAPGMLNGYTLGDGSPCLPSRNTCLVQIGAFGVGCHTLTTIRVEPDGSGDAATILEAVESAVPGDTILLAPGTFSGPGNRDIMTRGFQLLVTSEAGAAETVIDCGEGGDAYYGFYFVGGEDTSFVLEGVTITGAGKGGIYCRNGASPLIRDCVLTDNDWMGGWHGSGIVLDSGASPIVRRCEITGNDGNANGGGVYMRTSSAVLEDCVITGNTAVTSGGGIASGSTSDPVIRRCFISGNSAIDGSGGGIYSIMGSATVVDCEINDNTADYGGGGIFNGTSASINILRTLIAGNSTTSIGGGVYSASGMTMSFCTVADNYTEYYGAGIEVYQGPENHIYNSIVAFNRFKEGIFTISGDISITCSNVYGNEGGNYGGGTADMTGSTNISEDPLFCDMASGDYYLNADSPVLTPPHPICAEGMGPFGIRCGDSADLLFSSVVFDTMTGEVGSTIHVTAVVRNTGPAGAGLFRVSYYHDFDDPPDPGAGATWFQPVDTLASGDSVSLDYEIGSSSTGMWRSWMRIDPDEMVPEYNTDNNLAGPYLVTWTNPGGVLPESSVLRDVSPNPFGEETEIVYDLDRRTPAEVTIYDVGGRQLKIWKLPSMGPGRFTLTWDGTTDEGRPVASGVYFLRFKVDGVAEQAAKIVRVR
jgi:hypothetical protein